jgi:VanZ family protein
MRRSVLQTIILAELVLLAAGVVVAGLTAGFWPAMILAAFLAGGTALVALGRSIPPGVHALVLAVALLDAAGFAWGLYDRIPPYDELAHFFTSIAVSITIAYLLFDSEAIGLARAPAVFIVTVAGLTLGVGAMWEIIEWLGGFIGSRLDTLTDLILDAVGALIGASISVRLLRRDRGSRAASESSRLRRPARSSPRAAAS